MTVRTVLANGRSYQFSPDNEPPMAARNWLFVRARLVDEITLQPVTQDVRLQADVPGTVSRIADDGLVGLVGVPLEVLPFLAGRNFKLNLTIDAAGYLSPPPVAVVIPSHQRTTTNLPVRGDRIITL